MSTIMRFPARCGAVLPAACICLLLANGPAQARGKTKINYIPGITIVPDVFLPDGHTLRTYKNAPQGTTYWHEGLPIQQGDKIKVNSFVATGGADLQEIRVTLDNTQIADPKSSPWSAVVDTSQLSVGTHMLQVWAQASGDPPQSADKSLSFLVDKNLPPEFLVKGIQDIQAGGQQTEITPAPDPDSAPLLPAPVAGKAIDSAAAVSVGTRVASLPAGSATEPVGTEPVMIQEPIVFTVHPSAGSDATQYIYALVRDGQTILAPATTYSMIQPKESTVIKIQKRTDSTSGLRAGSVMLWVWGVDAEGRPGNPEKVQLQIPGP